MYPKLVGAAPVSVILTGEVLTAAKQTRHWQSLPDKGEKVKKHGVHVFLSYITSELNTSSYFLCFFLIGFVFKSCWQ